MTLITAERVEPKEVLEQLLAVDEVAHHVRLLLLLNKVDLRQPRRPVVAVDVHRQPEVLQPRKAKVVVEERRPVQPTPKTMRTRSSMMTERVNQKLSMRPMKVS